MRVYWRIIWICEIRVAASKPIVCQNCLWSDKIPDKKWLKK